MLRTSPPQIESGPQPAAAAGGGELGAAGGGEVAPRIGARSATAGAGAESAAVDEGPAEENCSCAEAPGPAEARTQRIPIAAAIRGADARRCNRGSSDRR